MLRRIAPPYRFLIDECLGENIVPQAVTEALEPGEQVIRFGDSDEFKRGTKDEIWLRKAGAAGLVIVTKDDRMRFRPNERLSLIEANAAVFAVSSATGPKMAEQLVRAMPTMRRVLRGQKPPFVGKVLDAGHIALALLGGDEVRKIIKRPNR